MYENLVRPVRPQNLIPPSIRVLMFRSNNFSKKNMQKKHKFLIILVNKRNGASGVEDKASTAAVDFLFEDYLKINFVKDFEEFPQFLTKNKGLTTFCISNNI